MPELSDEDIAYYKELGTTVCSACGAGVLPVELGGAPHQCENAN